MQHSSTFDEFMVVNRFVKERVELLERAHSSDILQGTHGNSTELCSHFLPVQETTESILKR